MGARHQQVLGHLRQHAIPVDGQAGSDFVQFDKVALASGTLHRSSARPALA